MLHVQLTPIRRLLSTPATGLLGLLSARSLASVTVADAATDHRQNTPAWAALPGWYAPYASPEPAIGGVAYAQQQAAPDLNALPSQMPFNVPFGTPITMERAQALVQAAIPEANKRGWPGNFAVVDWVGNLVVFARMDWAQLGSIAVAEHKARSAARYRQPTIEWENAVQKFGLNYILTLDDVIGAMLGPRR